MSNPSHVEALRLWLGVLITEIGDDDRPDLSARQQAVLLFVATRPGPHTVRALSAALAIPKPAITRAVDVLSDHALVKRRVDEMDQRSCFITQTMQGMEWLKGLAATIRHVWEDGLAGDAAGREDARAMGFAV